MWYQKLVDWYRRYGRRYPWRTTRDWYPVVVAEFMLIRTRSDVVLRNYIEFLAKYPKPEDLCKASDDELRNFFKKLGLLYRGPRLREVVCRILNDFGGVFPCREDAIRSLPGIGRYLTNVLLTRICMDPHPFIDTNVLRFAKRFLGREDVDIEDVENWLRSSVPKELLEEVNIAILDLAALICKPSRPRCNECPVAEWCSYARS